MLQMTDINVFNLFSDQICICKSPLTVNIYDDYDDNVIGEVKVFPYDVYLFKYLLDDGSDDKLVHLENSDAQWIEIPSDMFSQHFVPTNVQSDSIHKPTECSECLHEAVCKYNDGVNDWCKGLCPKFIFKSKEDI